jgi:hypothetical protein
LSTLRFLAAIDEVAPRQVPRTPILGMMGVGEGMLPQAAI